MMMLGIETATTVCAAAVIRDGVLLAEELVDERNIHAERLMGMVDAVFRRSGTSLDQMAGLAVSIGPGSFTGLRIGLSVVKGLAYAGEKPVVPVPTLRALAQKAAEASGTPDLILPLLDARRGDVYCAVYRKAGGDLIPVWDQQIMPLHAVAEAMREKQVLATGDARTLLEQLMRERFPESLHQLQVATEELARCSAATVARIGEQLLAQGKNADPGALEPQYLRDFLSTTHQ